MCFFLTRGDVLGAEIAKAAAPYAQRLREKNKSRDQIPLISVAFAKGLRLLRLSA